MAIITNLERYTDAVKEMYPRGKFFEREFINKDSDLSKITNIKGQEIYAFKLKMKELLDESNLLTCSEKTIGDYERIYKLEVLNALRYRPHGTHLSIKEAVEIADIVGAKKTYFTHMTHDVSHKRLSKELPRGVQPAFDNLKIEI